MSVSRAMELLEPAAQTDAQQFTALRAELLRARLHCSSGDQAAGLQLLAAAQSRAEACTQQLQTQDALDCAHGLLARATASLGEQSLQQNSLDAAWQLSLQASAHLSSITGGRPASPEAASILMLQQAVLQAVGRAEAADSACSPSAPRLVLPSGRAQSQLAEPLPCQAHGKTRGRRAAASQHSGQAAMVDSLPSPLPAGRLARQLRWRLLTQAAATFQSMPLVSRSVPARNMLRCKQTDVWHMPLTTCA